VPTRPAQAIRPSLAASQRPTPVPRCCFHLPRAWDNGASSRVHSRSPVRSSPLPVAPGWNGSPWASPPGFTPRRYQRRMPKWGRALGHLPGITSPASTSPPQRIHSPRGPSCRTPAPSSSHPRGRPAAGHARRAGTRPVPQPARATSPRSPTPDSGAADGTRWSPCSAWRSARCRPGRGRWPRSASGPLMRLGRCWPRSGYAARVLPLLGITSP